MPSSTYSLSKYIEVVGFTKEVTDGVDVLAGGAGVRTRWPGHVTSVVITEDTPKKIPTLWDLRLDLTSLFRRRIRLTLWRLLP